MSDIDKARGLVDADKLREIIHKNTFHGVVMDHRREAIVEEIESLLIPPLPTLEGLSDEERLKTKWGQADHATGRCVIVTPHVHTREGDGRSYDSATLMWPTGRIATVPHSEVTPRPDLPRLEWPSLSLSGESEDVSLETETNTEGGAPGVYDDGGPLLPGSQRINLVGARKLPTLADLIEQGNDPQKYVGMQCMMHDFPSTRVITKVRDSHVSALREDLEIQHATISKVTPRPDLPRLEWPGSGDAPTVAEQENVAPDQQVNPQVKLDSSRPRPEDVPVGEPWLVRNEGCRGQWVGTRDDSGTPNWPWILVKIDGTDYAFSQDVEVTLISRLVQEVTP